MTPSQAPPRDPDMPRVVHLWGITHGIQQGDWDVPARNLERFRARLRQYAIDLKVAAIAEETNQDAMRESAARGVLRGRILTRENLEWIVLNERLRSSEHPSIAAQVAADLGLAYRDCDPDEAERRALGIPPIEAPLSEEDAQTTARRREENFTRREMVWLERLMALGSWPSLFLCETDHVEGFKARLEAEGMTVNLIVDDCGQWGPYSPILAGSVGCVAVPADVWEAYRGLVEGFEAPPGTSAARRKGRKSAPPMQDRTTRDPAVLHERAACAHIAREIGKRRLLAEDPAGHGTANQVAKFIREGGLFDEDEASR